MEFCPRCANLLQYELPYRDRSARLFCPTCPYAYHLQGKVKIKRKQHLVRKEIEPVFSEEDRKNGPVTDGGLSVNMEAFLACLKYKSVIVLCVTIECEDENCFDNLPTGSLKIMFYSSSFIV
ncbi:hypothetical protein SAY86_010325 [Trapa natans]|uniref:DNA-directed RNA polymerase II subunit RPB9-like zinc ribbon domain-containing protein n=1 Tax=Trapa natans TaxID=22666 RepID=A0AAN7L5H0_TRANT|nr:hypothetical protein SAY86_010325 [Trapa natans]